MTAADPTDDPRVLALAREYLSELEAGRHPSRAGYEARYPELAAAVAECLDGVELAHAAGMGMRPPAPPPPPVEPSAQPLGDFRIVREIGRGGMGVVYEAVQLSLGRRVALKVLPFAAGLDAKHLQRFKTEAHAAAQLHHTNIVPVYAVGQDRGTHYYAMQLIDGRPLDAVIREMRQEEDGRTGDSTVNLTHRSTFPPSVSAPPLSTGSLTRRDRSAFATAARLAAQVADALDYAHDAGVIHRDIKPANLLLDAKGNVWVADFGLAQVNAEANVTRTGDIFGTLRYSSPEQATGRRTEVDHRTDVYSLGATLYELLTLQPIFPDTDRQSLLARILNDDPASPRTHDKNIPPELETIVLKAVAKAPADRYQSAGELAADLRRFLDDVPILARRPTLLDHARKWLRRHPAYTRAALVGLVVAAVGLGIGWAFAARAKDQTDGALAREKQRATEAEERFQIARKLADEHKRVANEDLANDPMQDALRRRMLETVLAYYQQFIDLRKDDPTAVVELQAVRAEVTGILSDLAVMAGAGKLELLRREDVQKELKKLGTARGDVLGVMDANPLDLGRRGELSSDQITARLVEHARKLDAEVRPLLTDDQQRRLNEIFLQSLGGRAFEQKEVIDKLKLTTDDRDKLRQIERQAFANRRSEFGGFGGGWGGPGGGERPPSERPGGGRPERPGGPGGVFPGGGRMDRGPQFWSPVADMVAALKPEQQEAWKKLIGEPFKFTGPGFGRGPGGDGPRGGGR